MSVSGNSLPSSDYLALQSELIERLELKRKLQLESSLPEFIRGAFAVLKPGETYQHNWHIDVIADALVACRRREIRRLIINIPPRCMKSFLCSVMWPAWIWATEPERGFMFVSYAQELSTQHSVDRRAVMSSDWYQSYWRDRVQFAADQNLKTEFQNTRRGRMIATSVGGTATGKGGDFIVVDDPHSPKQALSDVMRAEAIRFFSQTLVSRLDNQKTGVIVLIMQRLHEEDLSGYLLKKGGWDHICLPMEYEARPARAAQSTAVA